MDPQPWLPKSGSPSRLHELDEPCQFAEPRAVWSVMACRVGLARPTSRARRVEPVCGATSRLIPPLWCLKWYAARTSATDLDVPFRQGLIRATARRTRSFQALERVRFYEAARNQWPTWRCTSRTRILTPSFYAFCFEFIRSWLLSSVSETGVSHFTFAETYFIALGTSCSLFT